MRFSILIILFSALLFIGWSCEHATSSTTDESQEPSGPFLVVLGTTQDAGSPQAGCQKDCCLPLWEHPDPDRMVVSLGLVDPDTKRQWIFDATPDFPKQLHRLAAISGQDEITPPEGIFLTHGHIGHYTGLVHLGREVMGAQGVKVFAMPRMRSFLRTSGPWDQLVGLGNIDLVPIQRDSAILLPNNIRVIPLLVPHRAEYTETVGFRIEGPEKKVLFIPDIDKWEQWERSIIEEVKEVDVAFVDATFYDSNELPGRDMSKIPHPLVVETMDLFKEQPISVKNKLHFIHLNHTNPLLQPNSPVYRKLLKEGYRVASFGQIVEL